MTQIDFYTHVEHKLTIACQLASKAYERNLKVLLYTQQEEVAERLDQLLWTTPALGFVPHCSTRHVLAAETAVLIGDRAPDASHDDVLVNLEGEVPSFFSQFQRLVEIVSLDATDRQQARERFRFYRDRGYDIRSHDLGAPASGA
jgi:DNA polymerase III subunit chi